MDGRLIAALVGVCTAALAPAVQGAYRPVANGLLTFTGSHVFRWYPESSMRWNVNGTPVVHRGSDVDSAISQPNGRCNLESVLAKGFTGSATAIKWADVRSHTLAGRTPGETHAPSFHDNSHAVPLSPEQLPIVQVVVDRAGAVRTHPLKVVGRNSGRNTVTVTFSPSAVSETMPVESRSSIPSADVIAFLRNLSATRVAASFVPALAWPHNLARVSMPIASAATAEELQRRGEAPATSSELLPLTHANAPLGMTLATIHKRYPSCRLTKDDSWELLGLEPLNGYYPPFADLTPVDASGNYLTAQTGPFHAATRVGVGASGDAALDLNIVKGEDLNCGPRWSASDRDDYTIVLFGGRALAIVKYPGGSSDEDARALIETLATAVPGKRGPLHRAFTQHHVGPRGLPKIVPFYVTYVDSGDTRTVIGVESAYQDRYGVARPFVSIAYVDLTLWKRYAVATVTDMARIESSDRNHQQGQLRKLENRL